MPKGILTVLSLLTLAGVLLPGAEQDTARLALKTIIAQRDAAVVVLNAKLAADATLGAAIDFKLSALAVSKHHPLTFELYARGEKVYGGKGYLKSYNQATHTIDASGLQFKDGRLRGTMKVTLQADQWLPADHKPRFQEHVIDASVKDGAVTGWYRFTGHLGPDKDHLVGQAETVDSFITISAPKQDVSVPEGLVGLKELAQHATTAYRQLRAASLAVRDYPASYARCLERNRVRDPLWSGTDDATAVHINDYMQRLASRASAWDAKRITHTDFAVGFSRPADDRFGPFFSNSALEPDANGIVTLPPETGSAGPQRWQFISKWQVLGAFPAPNRVDHIDPQLPEMVRAKGAHYIMKTADMPDGRWILPDWLSEGLAKKVYSSYTEPKWYAAWLPTRPKSGKLREVTCKTASGRYEDSVLPPRWQAIGTKIPIYGCAKTFYFGYTNINSDKAQRIWAEAKASDAAQVWVNGQLAWHSLPDLDGHRRPKHAIFEMPLRKGVNEIVYRTRSDDPNSSYRLLLCTRGKPATAEQIAARQQSGVSNTVHFNWRGDGTGVTAGKPGVVPPISWDVDTGTNIKWSIPMPSYSNSSPVIVGDKVFTNCEPHWLYCFDRFTGKELWKVASSYAEFLPEEQQADAEAALAILHQKFQRQEDPELAQMTAERQALEQKLANAGSKMKDEEKEKLQQQSADLLSQINARRGSRHKGFRALKERGVGSGGWHDWTGFTMPTPVTDGQHIYVKYSSGVVACYTMAGKRQWMTDSYVTGGIPSCSSPVLVDGVIVVEGGPRKRRRLAGISRDELRAQVDSNGKEDLHWLVGLDAQTGKERWNTPVKCLPGGYGTPGGPRALSLSWDGKPVGVVVTQYAAFRASDGALLNLSTGNRPSHTGYVIGDRLYGDSVTKFWLESQNVLGVKHLLRSKGSVIVNGRFYSSPEAGGKVARTHVPWMALSVVDATNGKGIHRVSPMIEDAGTPFNYVPAAAYGDYVYLTDGKCGALDTPGVRARIVVVKDANPPEILARTELDSVTYSAPVFAEDGHMYVRTRRSLTCFATTPAGEELVQEKGVTELFFVKSKLPNVPPQRPIQEIKPLADFKPGDGVPVVKMYERLGPDAWLLAGPFTPNKNIDYLADIGGLAKAQLHAGQKIGAVTVTNLSPTFMHTTRGLTKLINNKTVFQYKTQILLTDINPKGGATNYFYTVIEVTRPRAFTYSNKGKGYKQYLAGVALEDGKDYRVSIGYYPLIIESTIGRLPPIGRKIKIAMTPQFIGCNDPVASLEAWRDKVRPYKKRLEAVLQSSNGKWIFEAKRYLSKLED